MTTIFSKLIGIGAYLPEYRLTNSRLEQLVDTSDEWIVQRTGIRERRIAMGMATWEMALGAAQQALEHAQLDPLEIDRIIVSTVTPDTYTPTVSCMVQGKLGAANAAAMDVGAACSGFTYALDLADSFIRAGKARNVLVVSAEALSRITDYTDRSTCVLFGDGAGAVVLQAAANDSHAILSTFLAADGTMGEVLYSAALPIETDPTTGDRRFSEKDRFLKMAGNDVFRFTATAVPAAIDHVLAQAEIDAQQVDWYVLHQANQRILKMVAKRYGLASEKVYVNIDHFGNTSSASIPLCLAEMQEKGLLQAGQLVVCVGFGGGLTYGAALIRL